MKAHALSLSFLLAVLPALSHPVAVPAADAQQQRESWQLPWSNGGGFVHAYRGPVREEFLQCDRGQCPLPAHGGTVPASGTAEGLSSAAEPATPPRQDETAAQGKAGEKAGQPAGKGRRCVQSKGFLPGKNIRQPPPRPSALLLPGRIWQSGQRMLPLCRRPPGNRPAKSGLPPPLPHPDRWQARRLGLCRHRKQPGRAEMQLLLPAQTFRPIPQQRIRLCPSPMKRLPIRRDWILSCRAVWTKAWPGCWPCWSSILPGDMRPMPNTGWARPCPARAGTKRP